VETLKNAQCRGVKIFGINFDPASGSLQCGPRHRHLSPKEARVLVILDRAGSGQVVRRQELMDAVWGQQDVGDEALTVVVSRLRHHFECLGVGDNVIETVPKAGYRLLAPASLIIESRQNDLSHARTQRLAWIALAVAVLATLLALLALIP